MKGIMTEDETGRAIRFLEGTLSKAEEEQFRVWLAADPTREQEFQWLSTLYSVAEEAGDKINVDAELALNHTAEKIGNGHKAPVRKIGYWIAAASVLAILTMFFLVRMPSDRGGTTILASDAVEQHVLPDGTKAWLRKGSSIAYANNFDGNIRRVTVNGLVYLDVVRDEKRPFEVEMSQSKVKVLGTSFELLSSPDTNAVSVTEGLVKLAGLLDSTDYILLKEGEGAGYSEDHGIASIVPVDIATIEWITQRLEFNNTALTRCVERLNKYYGSDIRVSSPGLGKCELTAVFTDQSLDEVLAELELVMGLKVQRDADTIYLIGKACE